MHSIQSFMVRILIRNGQDLMRHEKTDTTGFPSLDFPIMGGLRLKAQGSSSNSQFPHGCDPLTSKAAARAALLAGLGGLVLVFARAAARRLYHDLSQAGWPLQFCIAAGRNNTRPMNRIIERKVLPTLMPGCQVSNASWGLQLQISSMSRPTAQGSSSQQMHGRA